MPVKSEENHYEIDDELDLGEDDDIDFYPYDTVNRIFTASEPTMILSLDLDSSQSYYHVLEKVAKLLTGQRNKEIIEVVISEFSKEYNYNVPQGIIRLCCKYYSMVSTVEKTEGIAQMMERKIMTLYDMNKDPKRWMAQKHIDNLKAIYTGKKNSDPLYIAPLALNWDKGKTVDIQETVQYITKLLQESVNLGWKCVLIRYDGQPDYVNGYSHRYDEWCHAEDNWYLWWMLQNNNKTEDQSDCLVFKLVFTSYEKKEIDCRIGHR